MSLHPSSYDLALSDVEDGSSVQSVVDELKAAYCGPITSESEHIMVCLLCSAVHSILVLYGVCGVCVWCIQYGIG